MGGDLVTSMEVSRRFNPELPEWQHRANEAWIDGAWELLKLGGVWIYPDAMRCLTKTEDGWDLMGDNQRPCSGHGGNHEETG